MSYVASQISKMESRLNRNTCHVHVHYIYNKNIYLWKNIKKSNFTLMYLHIYFLGLQQVCFYGCKCILCHMFCTYKAVEGQDFWLCCSCDLEWWRLRLVSTMFCWYAVTGCTVPSVTNAHIMVLHWAKVVHYESVLSM